MATSGSAALTQSRTERAVVRELLENTAPQSVLPHVAVVAHVDVSQSRLAEARGLLKLLDGGRMEATAGQVHRATGTLQTHRKS